MIHRLMATLLLSGSIVLPGPRAGAEVRVDTEASAETTHFEFLSIAPPAIDDLAATARVNLVSGKPDANSAPIRCLVDGKIPDNDDQPTACFFFAPGTRGGRLTLDFGTAADIAEIATYSWHSGSRAAQHYSVFGATGEEPGFRLTLQEEDPPTTFGWQKIANVDSRRPNDVAGQHAARIHDAAGVLGRFRYLLFEIRDNGSHAWFGNTFFGEIDVLAAAAEVQRIAVPEKRCLRFATADDRYHFTIDCGQAPELAEWSAQNLMPVIREWYPRIVALLPSDRFTPPADVTFRYRSGDSMRGIPAWAQGSTISMNAPWMRSEKDREAVGAVVHEMVHVVQAYQRNERNRGRAAPPGWIVEGIPDYVRWFLYEPQSRGALLTPAKLAEAKHDASYRVSANFLDYVIRQHDAMLLPKLNAAAREGRYDDALWRGWTGKTLAELADAWRANGRP